MYADKMRRPILLFLACSIIKNKVTKRKMYVSDILVLRIIQSVC